MLKANIVFPANYFEKKIQQNGNEIVRAEKVTEALVPEGCQYGAYSRQGKILYGNLKPGNFRRYGRILKTIK